MNKKLGATGEFPEGKIRPSDEGELRMAIGIEKNNVIIDFGTLVQWLGLPKQKAYELAHRIKAKADLL